MSAETWRGLNLIAHLRNLAQKSEPPLALPCGSEQLPWLWANQARFMLRRLPGRPPRLDTVWAFHSSPLPQGTSAQAREAGPAVAHGFFLLPSLVPCPSSPGYTDDTLARASAALISSRSVDCIDPSSWTRNQRFGGENIQRGRGRRRVKKGVGILVDLRRRAAPQAVW